MTDLATPIQIDASRHRVQHGYQEFTEHMDAYRQAWKDAKMLLNAYDTLKAENEVLREALDGVLAAIELLSPHYHPLTADEYYAIRSLLPKAQAALARVRP